MMNTPIVIKPMAKNVGGNGFSLSISQPNSAPNIGLKARMNTRFAVVVA